jgi:hypothetical protein
MVLLITEVQSEPEAQLMQLRQTRHARRFGPGRRQSRQQERCQDGDDGHHDQQFDQGEAILALSEGQRFHGLGAVNDF